VNVFLPVPSSPVKGVGGGFLSPSQPCRITHGPNAACFENLVGKPVGLVRRCLASLFGITDEAEPWVGGAVVGADYRLCPGDSVEFLVRRGLKSLGDLLTREQLIQRWQIDNDMYLQLLDAGLPTVRFKGGSVRHPEVAVDEWLRRIAEPCYDRPALPGTQGSADGSATRKWCNIEEAALLSGRSVTTIRRDIRAGTLRAHVVGRGRRRPSYRIRRADLKAYIRAGLAETPDPPVVPTTTVKKKSRHFD
jgi:excisionase family DNA binding protein